MKNYGADMELIYCNQQLDDKFDCIEDLKKMLRKYENIHWNMESLLHIAMQYYNKKDYVNSAKYFKQAIDLNIESQLLKVNEKILSFFREYMIEFISRSVFEQG